MLYSTTRIIIISASQAGNSLLSLWTDLLLEIRLPSAISCTKNVKKCAAGSLQSCGAGCFRYRTEPRNGLRGNERLQDILRAVPYWFGPKLPAYIGKDHTLPFDQHFLKAAVAPRMLIETSAREDTWANPVGSYLTYEAAREVYQLLGVPDNIAYRIRPGGHAHTPEDFNVLFAFMENPLSVTDGYDIKP